MKPKFKDVAHFYPNAQIEVTSIEDNQKHIDTIEGFVVGESINLKQWGDYYFEDDDLATIKPILKPMSEITEDDFREFATSELLGKNEKMAFDFSNKHTWKAASYSTYDFNSEWNDAQIIYDKEESGPEEIIMLHRFGNYVSFGWITSDESYHTCDIDVTSRWIAFLCSKSFNVFGLPESETATI